MNNQRMSSRANNMIAHIRFSRSPIGQPKVVLTACAELAKKARGVQSAVPLIDIGDYSFLDSMRCFATLRPSSDARVTSCHITGDFDPQDVLRMFTQQGYAISQSRVKPTEPNFINYRGVE